MLAAHTCVMTLTWRMGMQSRRFCLHHVNSDKKFLAKRSLIIGCS